MNRYSRKFTVSDQEIFAEIVGDYNPMHMNPVFARRTQAGECAVHGIHAALWALETLAAAGIPVGSFKSLRVRFLKFIFLDEVVRLAYFRIGASVRVELEVGGSDAVVVVLDADYEDLPEVSYLSETSPIVFGKQPIEQNDTSIASFKGWIEPDRKSDKLAGLFPLLASCFGIARLESIALLSTLVGMVCPGANSIFSDFTLFIDDSVCNRAGIGAKTASFRLQVVTLDVLGFGLCGEVNAIERLAPVEPSMEKILRSVRPREFEDQRALIVGGSRGLGAVTARLIAAGGGRFYATYSHGVAEATKLVEELASFKELKTSSFFKFDVLTDRLPLNIDFNCMYYFATPKIFRRKGRVFDNELLHEFLNFYVSRFASLVLDAVQNRPQSSLFILYPSSEAVVTRPPNMTEYAMAKAAGEVLCEDLERSVKQLTIFTPRLPRILTDQTATVPVVKAADSIDTMLELMRSKKLISALEA